MLHRVRHGFVSRLQSSHSAPGPHAHQKMCVKSSAPLCHVWQNRVLLRMDCLLRVWNLLGRGIRAVLPTLQHSPASRQPVWRKGSCVWSGEDGHAHHVTLSIPARHAFLSQRGAQPPFWSSLSDDFWRRPENGGRGRGGVAHPIFLDVGNGQMFSKYADGVRAMQGTSTDQWKRELSGCRVEAVAFDGVERLFWPIYEAADPDVKVISLNWRSFEEYFHSANAFGPALYIQMWIVGILQVSYISLPWPLLMTWIDGPLLNHRLKTYLETGWPPMCQEYDMVQAAYHMSVGGRRVATAWFSGVGAAPMTRSEYRTYWSTLKQRVPSSQVYDFDMRRHGWEELCEAVGIDRKECPKRGKLPRAVNLLNFERDFPLVCVCMTSLTLMLHWVNWRIINICLDFYFGAAYIILAGFGRVFILFSKLCVDPSGGDGVDQNDDAGVGDGAVNRCCGGDGRAARRDDT